jgi:ribonucleoside-diphosphate reductase alpha chain
VEVDPLFEEIARSRGFYSRALMERIAENASIQNIDGIPEDVKKMFVTAHDISPEWHVRMQAAFQKYVHNATSKTINFPHEATVEEVRKAYLLAYELGCKGITIYRDKSRDEQVLNVGNKEAKADNKIAPGTGRSRIAPRPRPEVIQGTTTKVATGCGNLYITINIDEAGRPFELFTQMGKAGGCAASQLEAIGRLVSLGFRSGIEVRAIIEQLRNIRTPMRWSVILSWAGILSGYALIAAGRSGTRKDALSAKGAVIPSVKLGTVLKPIGDGSQVVRKPSPFY